MSAGFTHLHVHTQYSLLDGAIRIADLLEKCKEYDMDSVAITDHGAMFGALEFYSKAKKAGIKLHGCFMVGNPGETKETLETTLKFAKELNPDTAQFFPIMVYPGTEAYQWAKSNGFLTTSDFREWLTPDGMHNSIVSRPGLSNTELVEFCDRARKEFYIRPSYIFRKMIDGLTDLQEFKRLAKGGWTLGRHIFRGTYGGGKK